MKSRSYLVAVFWGVLAIVFALSFNVINQYLSQNITLPIRPISFSVSFIFLLTAIVALIMARYYQSGRKVVIHSVFTFVFLTILLSLFQAIRPNTYGDFFDLLDEYFVVFASTLIVLIFSLIISRTLRSLNITISRRYFLISVFLVVILALVFCGLYLFIAKPIDLNWNKNAKIIKILPKSTEDCSKIFSSKMTPHIEVFNVNYNSSYGYTDCISDFFEQEKATELEKTNQTTKGDVVNNNSQSGLKTYTNSQYGFSFQYPEGISVSAGNEPMGVFVGDEHINVTNKDGSFAAVIILEKNSNNNLDQAVQSMIQKYGPFNGTNISSTKLAGKDSKSYVAKNINEEYNLVNMGTVTIDNGNVIAALSGTKNKNIFDQILNSFKFTK